VGHKKKSLPMSGIKEENRYFHQSLLETPCGKKTIVYRKNAHHSHVAFAYAGSGKDARIRDAGGMMSQDDLKINRCPSFCRRLALLDG
jgi:hypothetical protein